MSEFVPGRTLLADSRGEQCEEIVADEELLAWLPLSTPSLGARSWSEDRLEARPRHKEYPKSGLPAVAQSSLGPLSSGGALGDGGWRRLWVVSLSSNISAAMGLTRRSVVRMLSVPCHAAVSSIPGVF